MSRAGLATTLALSACGPPQGLGVALQPLGPGVKFDLRIFGAAVTCDMASTPSARSRLKTVQLCTAAQADTSNSCHISRVSVESGANTRVEEVTPGTRVIFGLELDAGDVEIGWACTAVEVRAGAVASATLTFAPN